jgi:hypothetical protein
MDSQPIGKLFYGKCGSAMAGVSGTGIFYQKPEGIFRFRAIADILFLSIDPNLG